MIGDAIAIVATKLLTDGISSSYPCTEPHLDPSKRFYLWQTRAEDRQDMYVIHNVDLDIQCDMQKSWLLDEKFDLVSWYRRYLSQQGYFEYKYYNTHQNLYFNCPGPSALGVETPGSPIDPSADKENTQWGDLPDLESLVSTDDLFEENSRTDDAEVDDVPDLHPLSDSDDSDNEEEEDLYKTGRMRTRLMMRK